MSRLPAWATAVLFALAIIPAPATAQAVRSTITSGRRYPRLVIRGAMVVDGSGTPASGPKDIVIENNTIADVVSIDSAGTRRPTGENEIDATGKYVLPGLINAHGHIQDERGGVPQPLEYQFKLWLASGITTVRDVGSDTLKAVDLRHRSAAGEIAAPRLFIYPMIEGPRTPDAARAMVRAAQASGGDGVKFIDLPRDMLIAAADEAHKAGLRIAHHAGVSDANAWDDIRSGITSIEHWYGIPDAALDNGVQNFPATYNYSDEADRFRYAGHLWKEANPEKLLKVLDGMVAAEVAWDPTFSIYEASRDLERAQTRPFFREYLHPTLEKFFQPNPANHGSYFYHWTSSDEAAWRENYRIWMAAVREFERRGGLVGVGEDAGYIYSIYGFGLLRELELQQEAGFPPLKVIQHATVNNARILGQEAKLGRVRPGFTADLIVVNGNPLEDLKLLYPTGVEVWRDGRPTRTGGIEWTIKDGIPYHGPTLMNDVKEIVSKARGPKGAFVGQ